MAVFTKPFSQYVVARKTLVFPIFRPNEILLQMVFLLRELLFVVFLEVLKTNVEHFVDVEVVAAPIAEHVVFLQHRMQALSLSHHQFVELFCFPAREHFTR